MSNDLKNNAEWSKARANVYGLLAEVFRSEPSSSFLNNLQDPHVTETLQNMGCSLWDDIDTSSHEQLGEDLALEYTRLFIGPGPRVSPHQSMHVDSRFGEENELWSEETVEVKKFMEGAGVAINDGFIGMPDHISAEFEFMEQLLKAEEEAWSNSDDETAFNILKIQERFYNEHIVRWVPNFCEKLADFAKHPFYKEFADVTNNFISFEGETFKEFLGDCSGCDKLSA
ncbi:molecular chaperone TorD family protein [Magnetovibrio sp. PR-2]|uniref:TorD/DmsD family molecular chaperone n=1 Tax=Magnetovibrio sp. PR-2 TaxID=3120356 RepID=UPI002FCE4B30